MIVHQGLQFNYTSVLNALALLAFAVIYWLYRHRDTSGQRYAKDPVCGMQVEIEHGPATARADGEQYWFCSDHCQHRFTADPARFLTAATEPSGSVNRTDSKTGVDPGCGMTVDVTSAEHTAEHHETQYYFCGAGCRTAFLTDRESYLTHAPAVAPDNSVLKLGAPSDCGARQ